MEKTNISTNPISGKIYALILTLAILIIGTFFYFATINNSAGMAPESAKSMNTNSQEKIMSDNNAISENNQKTPNNINPEYSEESMNNEGYPEESMNNEDYPEELIDSESLYEIKTQESSSLLNHILQENKIFTKKNTEGSIKLFYYYVKDEPLEVQLSEGNIDDYQIHTIGGQNYYPIILGASEAGIMRKEGLFENIGDPIKNFFGKNVVIVGIMKETGGILDTAHLIPLNNGELN